VLVAMLRASERGDADAAFELYRAFLPLIVFEQQPAVGVALRKDIFRLRGLLATADGDGGRDGSVDGAAGGGTAPRRPATPLAEETRDALRRVIDRTFGGGEAGVVDLSLPMDVEGRFLRR